MYYKFSFQIKEIDIWPCMECCNATYTLVQTWKLEWIVSMGVLECHDVILVIVFSYRIFISIEK
jgi:hypothetical protein